MKSKTIFLAITLAVGAAAAQEKPEKKEAKPAAAPAKADAKPAAAPAKADAKPAAAPPMPTLSPEGKKFIEAWNGHWKSSDAVFTVGTEKQQGNLKINCEKAAAGWASLCKATFNVKGMPPGEGVFVMAWDMGTGEAHMFEVQNTGEVHDHSGKWKDDKSVSLVRQGKNIEGKDEKDDCTATFASAKDLKLECTGTQGTTTAWTFTSTFKK